MDMKEDNKDNQYRYYQGNLDKNKEKAENKIDKNNYNFSSNKPERGKSEEDISKGKSKVSFFESPINAKKIPSPYLSPKQNNNEEGMKNIILNKDKNLTILSFDKLFQGSLNQDFSAIYGNYYDEQTTLINTNMQTYELNTKNCLTGKIENEKEPDELYIRKFNVNLKQENKEIISIQALNKYNFKKPDAAYGINNYTLSNKKPTSYAKCNKNNQSSGRIARSHISNCHKKTDKYNNNYIYNLCEEEKTLNFQGKIVQESKFLGNNSNISDNNINNNYNNTNYFEKLSNYSKIYKNKIEKIRQEENMKRANSHVPQITKKAQDIVRDSNLYYYRLHPYHKLLKIKNKNKQMQCLNYRKSESRNKTLSNIIHSDSIRNMSSRSYVMENIRRLRGIDDVKTYIIYRTYKNKDFLSLKDSNFDLLNNSYNTWHEPSLNFKSLKIADNLEPAYYRLTKEASNKKKFPNNKNKSQENALISSYDDVLIRQIRSFNNLERKENKVYSPKNVVKVNERALNLYTLGLESMKKKEFLSSQKKREIEDIQNKTFSYVPNINKKSPVYFTSRSNKANGILSQSKSPSSSINYNSFESKQKFSKENKRDDDYYNKSIIWQKNLQQKIENFKINYERNNNSKNTFKPYIKECILPTDKTFVDQNQAHIGAYISKRRNFLKKCREDEQYVKSKFNYGENYKVKPTITKEFNLSYKNFKENYSVQKKLLNNLPAPGLENKGNQKINKNHTFSLTKQVNGFCSSLNNSRIKKFDINKTRENLKIKDFFISEVFSQIDINDNKTLK